MGTIIELAGARGVGKSTTLDILEKKYPKIRRNEGFIKNHMPADTPEQFVIKQKTYISDCIELIRQLRQNNDITFITRGAEEIIVYTETYLKIYHPEWDVLKELSEDFNMLKENFADKVVYFDCPIDQLKKRWEKDAKIRKDFDFWMEYNHVSFEFYKKNCPECIFVDADKTSPEQRALILEKIMLEAI